MIVVTRLLPTIPVMTPKGAGRAHFFIYISEDHHNHWKVEIDETGEFWEFDNTEVRARPNRTMRTGTARPAPVTPE